MNDHSIVDCTNLISAFLLRLQMKSPFFGALAMFGLFIPTTTISSAATDGRDIFFNPEFLMSLPSPQQDGVLLHEILHAALLHPLRLREREPQLWNIAADIVVNGMILRQRGSELPPGGLRNKQLEDLSVEEVYELLRATGADRSQLADLDLLAMNGDLAKCSIVGTCVPARNRSQALTAYWRQALQQATAIVTTQSGKLPIGID